ncbi:MAG: hypothetical protein Q7S34_01185, partial [bacterium]|nr:hypothetical protein [bacterium]
SYENHGVSIVTILVVIIFFGVVALSAGSYLYRGLLIKKLADKKEVLEKAKEGFDLETIKKLKRLDIRIESAKSLLEQHIATSAFFDILESATLKTVRFKDLSLSIKAQNSASIGGATISDNPLQTGSAGTSIDFKMNGIAKSYNSVALQSDLFNKTKGFKEPIFSSLNLNELGEISFIVSALLDPQVLLYRTAEGLGNKGSVSTTSQASNQTTENTTNAFNPASN